MDFLTWWNNGGKNSKGTCMDMANQAFDAALKYGAQQPQPNNNSSVPCSCKSLYVNSPKGVALLAVNPECLLHGTR